LYQRSTPKELLELFNLKMIVWTEYLSAREKLEAGELTQELVYTARNKYIENRKIYTELDYYRNTGSILGRHPIFGNRVIEQELRALSPKELFKKQHAAQKAVRHTKSLLAKNERPDLVEKRLVKLEKQENMLELVQKVVNSI
jgi:hypothetical protein